MRAMMRLIVQIRACQRLLNLKKYRLATAIERYQNRGDSLQHIPCRQCRKPILPIPLHLAATLITSWLAAAISIARLDCLDFIFIMLIAIQPSRACRVRHLSTQARCRDQLLAFLQPQHSLQRAKQPFVANTR